MKKSNPSYKHLFYLILIFFGHSIFGQKTFEWNVNVSMDTSLFKGTSIIFTNFDTAQTFTLVKFTGEEARQIQPDSSLLIDSVFIKLFGGAGQDIVIRSESKQTELTITIKLQTYEYEPKPIIYDVLEIKENLDKSCALGGILAAYDIKDANALKNNGFLNSLISPESVDFNCAGGAGEKQGDFPGTGSGLFSKLGGLDVTKYADGLAKFLVKRAKEELAIEFFEDFKNAIKETKNKDFQMLFPSTTSTLQIIDEEIYNYHRYLGMLREQFEVDLNTLPENFRKIVETEHQNHFEQKPYLKASLISATDIVIGVRDKKHPGAIINSLNAFNNKDHNPTAVGSIKTVQFISESIKEKESDNDKRYWAEKSVLDEVFNNDTTFRIYLGLLAQRSTEVKFDTSDTLTLSKLLLDLGKTIERAEELKPYFKNIISNAETISSLIKAGSDSDKKLSGEDIYRYANSINEIIGSVTPILKKLNINKGLEELKKITIILVQSMRLYTNIVNKKYSAAISNLLLLYKKAFETPDESDQLELIKRYGAFMAAMLQAENSDDVASIIEAYALPAGSARVKRNTHKSFSLNAYLGPFVGAEYPFTAFGDWNKDSIDFGSGLTAPVGFALSWGKIKICKKNGSLSLFVSLIDIGALADFRFKDNEREVAKIYLREIFSPGLHGSFGFPNSPISVNLGIQKTALLQRIGNGDNDVDLFHRLRGGLSLVLDIPLMNLGTKGKKSKTN